MKSKKKIKILFNLIILLTLNNCVQSTAGLLGPAITGAKTGNLYQSGFSYASNNIIKNQLGETPANYVKNLLTQSPRTEKVNFSTNKEVIENIKLLSISKNSDIEYNEFIRVVKKTLK